MPAPTDGAPAPESPQSPVLSPSSPAPAAGEDEADDMSGIDEGLEYVSEEESEGGRWDQFIGDGPPEWEGPGTLHQAQPSDTTPPTQSQLPAGAPVAQPAIAAAPAETAPQIATQAFQNHQVPPHLAPHPRTTMLLGQTYTERQLAVIDAAVLALLSTGLTPEFVFGLLNGDSRAFWASVPGPKLLFFLSYFRSNGNVPPETITLIKETLRDYLPAELHDKFQVYTSDIGNNTSNGSPQPFLFAAANPAAFVAIRTAVEALKVQKVLSTPKATLVFLGVRAPPSSFVGLYGGLYLDESDASRAIVIRLLSTHLRSWRDLQVWLGSDPAHHDAVPVGMMAGGVVDWIASTLSAFPLRIVDRGTSEVIWRIHTATFSTSQAVMDRFARMLKTVRIQALEISGVSSFKRNNFNCGACRGRDHPTGLCPLKSAPGFFDLDPNPHTAPPTVAAIVTPTVANDDDFIPGLHVAPNTNASRGHFTSSPSHRGRGSHGSRGGQGSYRGRGAARGNTHSRGSHRGSWH
ncbi:hypothetical protein DFP72DRAFT_1149674 [Ephemerocybe angulata]|uniref:Uncharacterized protein n=1 Tax=Ephemerocybe angulata TaxID=980116 RepID=A0A8H6HK74_9AGAR|nr:hypothetical protein DFP72DRAFT_1149674 [Tulosesus angulatus]